MLLNTAGPEVMVPLDPSRSVYPSALAFATAAVPIRPPAPLRFSTMTCWPRASENAGATVRAVMSTLPLGGQGTTIFTVRLGKSCALAPAAAAAIARTGIHRVIICPSPAERRTRFSHTGVDLLEYAGYPFVYGGERRAIRRSDRRVPTCLQPKGSKFS